MSVLVFSLVSLDSLNVLILDDETHNVLASLLSQWPAGILKKTLDVVKKHIAAKSNSNSYIQNKSIQSSRGSPEAWYLQLVKYILK